MATTNEFVDNEVDRKADILAGIILQRLREDRQRKREAEEALRRSQDAADAALKPEVVVHKEPEVKGRLHYKFPLLLAAAKAKVNCIALVGPAGTGKTRSSAMVADMLKLKFEATSFGPTTSKADLFGFRDGQGVFHSTPLVRAAKDGGVFLGDEFDAGHAGVSTALNMVTANDKFSTPEGMTNKHPDFIAIVAMNTYGNGANRVYVGRNQQDGATMDRCVVIDWDQDPGLEAAIIGIKGMPSPKLDFTLGGTMSAEAWLNRVWSVRKAVESLGIRHIVSTRATQNGWALLQQGVGRTHVESMVLWKGLDSLTVAKIKMEASK